MSCNYLIACETLKNLPAFYKHSNLIKLIPYPLSKKQIDLQSIKHYWIEEHWNEVCEGNIISRICYIHYDDDVIHYPFILNLVDNKYIDHSIIDIENFFLNNGLTDDDIDELLYFKCIVKNNELQYKNSYDYSLYKIRKYEDEIKYIHAICFSKYSNLSHHELNSYIEKIECLEKECKQEKLKLK